MLVQIQLWNKRITTFFVSLRIKLFAIVGRPVLVSFHAILSLNKMIKAYSKLKLSVD